MRSKWSCSNILVTIKLVEINSSLTFRSITWYTIHNFFFLGLDFQRYLQPVKCLWRTNSFSNIVCAEMNSQNHLFVLKQNKVPKDFYGLLCSKSIMLYGWWSILEESVQIQKFGDVHSEGFLPISWFYHVIGNQIIQFLFNI